MPKPEKFSAYTKHTMQLLHLEMYNINFIHKIGQKKHKEFLETNPQITEIFNEDYWKELPDTSISFNEFTKLKQTNPSLVDNLLTKASRKERTQKAWLFDRWMLYQEVIIVMSLIESFLRESFDPYVIDYPNEVGINGMRSNSDEICFSKLLGYFMDKELKLVQRFGPKNVKFLSDFWIKRCAIIHNNGVINERSLRKKEIQN